MWYAIQVMTGKEAETILLCKELVQACLLEDILYPKKEVMKKYHGEWHKMKVGMFPGYIFAITETIEQLYEAFKKVPKLVKLIGTGKEPVALSEQETQFLEKIVNNEYVVEVSQGYIVGSKLTIQSGPMIGMEGMVKRIDRHKKIAKVEVEMFGRRVEIELGLEVLKKE